MYLTWLVCHCNVTLKPVTLTNSLDSVTCSNFPSCDRCNTLTTPYN